MVNQIDIAISKAETEKKIIDLLEKEDLSIAELQRRTQIKRSTLIYHLNGLESQQWITRERIQEKETGRPTIIKFNKTKKEEYFKALEDRQKESFERNKKLIVEILSFYSENNSQKMGIGIGAVEEIFQRKGYEWLQIRQSLNYIHVHKLVASIITSDGIKFLKEHSK